MPYIPNTQVSRSTYSGARVTKSGDQVLGGAADLTWDQEDWDTDNYHDNVTNNAAFTIPATGRYRIGVFFRMTTEAEGFASISRSDGVILVQDYSGGQNTRFCTVDAPAIAGQTITSSFGSAVTIKAGGGGYPVAAFWIQRLI